MPVIDNSAAHQDLRRLFGMAWRQARASMAPQARLAAGQRCVAVVTPGRMIHLLPAPKPGSVSPHQAALVQQLFPADRALQIAVISYTGMPFLLQDPARCIPFLGMLLGLSYAGHDVVVFEGQSQALPAALRGANVLIVDSGMAPFLDSRWIDLAMEAMSESKRIFLHDRRHFSLLPVIKSRTAAEGWRVNEPDGEVSYANCLLLTLAKVAGPAAVSLVVGRPVPDLRQIVESARERAWAEELPFRYEELDPLKVASVFLGAAAKREGKFRAQLALADGQRHAVEFQLSVEREGENVRQLTISRQVG